MKTLIVALNSKYIHSSLAAWYLKAYCGSDCGEVKVYESTINDLPDSILSDIYLEKADVIGFSCYIWNIEEVLRVAKNLKKISPDAKIVLGGPEVSFDARDILEKNEFVDFVISGEGEIPFKQLLRQLTAGIWEPQEIEGLTYRDAEGIVSNNPAGLIENLDSIPSPYTDEMLDALKGKIVYFEASRGCPFSCSYCLSSTFEGVRYFSIERVRNDLKRLMRAGIKLVKFVDRTFNCNRKRAKEIFRFIISETSDTAFHFEAAADLFDDEMIEILSHAPPGRIQFEIGIQTTNPRALELINRKTDLNTVFNYAGKLRDLDNIHIHLDLIAGLPGEDYDSFTRSFDDVYRLRPHQLQLGFLKMLKGSGIRKDAEKFGYVYRDYPPYEVLFNHSINFDEILELKGIEDLVERYYNSGKFQASLDYLTKKIYESPFAFFKEFHNFCRDEGFAGKALSSRDWYTVLLRFLRKVLPKEHLDIMKELLKLDYLSSYRSNNLPDGIERDLQPGFKEWCFKFLKNTDNLRRYLPEFVDIPAKQIYKKVHFETFSHDVVKGMETGEFEKRSTVVLFRYHERDPVTGLFSYTVCSHDMRHEAQFDI